MNKIEITDEDFKEIKNLIDEAFEFAEQLPNITDDIINTNIHYRIWKLKEIIDNLK